MNALTQNCLQVVLMTVLLINEILCVGLKWKRFPSLSSAIHCDLFGSVCLKGGGVFFLFLRNCCLNAFTMVIVSKVLLMSYVNEGGRMVIGLICILNMFFLNLWYTSSADGSTINSCLFSLDFTADIMFTLHLCSSTQSNHKERRFNLLHRGCEFDFSGCWIQLNVFSDRALVPEHTSYDNEF